MSPLSQIGALSTAGNTLLNTLGLGSALTNVGKNLGDWFTKTSSAPAISYNTDGSVVNSTNPQPNTDPGYSTGV